MVVQQVCQVTRLPGNPVVLANSPASIGSNVNGPSVIRVPDWVSHRLGKYYLYFAHHAGKYIRLAYADAPAGPWHVHEPGSLSLAQARQFRGHIASPDVHVDHEARKIRMYFHGREAWRARQSTGVALSDDGINFEALPGRLGPFYFRVFTYRGKYYAFAKPGRGGRGELFESQYPDRGFQSLGTCAPGMRHAAVWKTGDTLRLIYSRIGDCPERLVGSSLDLAIDPRGWCDALTEPVEVLAPDVPFEGSELAARRSRPGIARRPERALRDPFVFSDVSGDFLFYAVQGEQGLAVAGIRPG